MPSATVSSASSSSACPSPAGLLPRAPSAPRHCPRPALLQLQPQAWASLLLLLPLLFLIVFAHSFSLALPGLPLTSLHQQMTGPRSPSSSGQRPLRAMSFNIWVSGANVENGMEKIARQIEQVDPDIVALQEVSTPEVATNLTALLGASTWKCAFHPYAKYPDTAILTKHKFVLEEEFVHLQFQRNISDFIFHEQHFENNSMVTFGMGATIQLQPDGQLVNFYSVHLDWRSYGPYAANNKQVTSAKQIMAGERNKQGYGRAQNIEQLLANEQFKRHLQLADKVPLVVAGDFNAPSHLDWTEETTHIHGGWLFEWPATKLMEEAGFDDSFRRIHPDVEKQPGITWSTVQKAVGPEWDWEIPEPQDRIDFILYKPSQLFRPLHSYTFAGKDPLRPIPEQSNNSWPSDHFSVITEFTIDLLAKVENPMEGDKKEQLQFQLVNSTAVEDGVEG